MAGGGFDTVIVGGGTAGCVLAARLSADPNRRILLLEAGSAGVAPWHRMPLAFFATKAAPALNWNLASEAETGANGRSIPLPRGRLLGGSSAINGMLHTRGHPRDFDAWPIGWSWDDNVPWFARAERHWRGMAAQRGASGIMPLSSGGRDGPLRDALLLECGGAVDSAVDDTGDADGLVLPDFTIDRQWRVSAAQAYLRPVRRRANLVVRIGAEVADLVFEGRRAVGVRYRRAGRMVEIRADRVILSAGVYQTPKLLMLAGIGDPRHLAEHGIAVRVALPGVGANLQDHASFPMVFGVTPGASLVPDLRVDRLAVSTLKWLLRRPGPVGQVPLAGLLFHRLHADSVLPEIETMVIAAAPDARIWCPVLRPMVPEVAVFSNVLLRPASRGRVLLRSTDPAAAPRIQLNLLAEETDRMALRGSVELVRDLVRGAGLRHVVRDERAPTSGARTPAQIDAAIAATVATAQHGVGTCAMGLHADSVVTPDMAVRGIERLHVVDASVMPAIVGAHTNAATMMIAERAAHILGAP